MAQNIIDWYEIIEEFTKQAKSIDSNKIHFDSPESKVCIDGGSQSKGLWIDCLLLDAVVCFYRGQMAGSSKRTLNQHNIMEMNQFWLFSLDILFRIKLQNIQFLW